MTVLLYEVVVCFGRPPLTLLQKRLPHRKSLLHDTPAIRELSAPPFHLVSELPGDCFASRDDFACLGHSRFHLPLPV